MAIKVGINGFGRIGRNILRTALDDKNLELIKWKTNCYRERLERR